MAGELRVEPHRALLQRGEGHVPGGEADAGADRGDVVEVVVEALELEQQRAGAAQLRVEGEPDAALAGLGVGDRVGDGAGAAGALGEASPSPSSRPSAARSRPRCL